MMKKAIWSIGVLLIVATLAYPQQVSFKLKGGLSWINGDDYNKGIAGENQYIKDTSSTMSGAYAELRSGMNFEAEIIVHMGPRFAFGFGGGYYRLQNDSTVTSHGVLSDAPFDAVSTYKPRLSTIPLYVNIHYLAPLTSQMKLDIYAGPLFQIVQYTFENPSTTTISSVNQILTFTSSTTSFGFQGGVGLSYTITPGLSLIAETCYRYGTVFDLSGNWVVIGTSDAGAINNSSDSYYMWVYNYTQGGTYTRIGYSDVNGPTGSGVSNASKAVIRMSGITATIGVKFSL
jgi:hypothetical protein